MPAQPRNTASLPSVSTATRHTSVTILRASGSVARMDAEALPSEAVMVGQILCPSDRACERGDDAETAAEKTRGVHGRFRDTDDRSGRELAGSVDAGVAETGNDVAVDPGGLAAGDLGENAWDTEGFVDVAFDRHRSHGWADRIDDRARADYGPGTVTDRCGHRTRGVRIDDLDEHVRDPMLSLECRSW